MTGIDRRRKLSTSGAVACLLLLAAACGGDDRARPLVPEYVPDGMVVLGSSWSEPGPRERQPTDPEWITVVPVGVDDPFDGPTLTVRKDPGATEDPVALGGPSIDLGGTSAAASHDHSNRTLRWLQDGSLVTLTGRWVEEDVLTDVARSMVSAPAGSSPSEWVPDGWTVAEVADLVTDGHSGGSLELGTVPETVPRRVINLSWNAGGAPLHDFFRAGASAPSSCVEQSLAACGVTFDIDGRQALQLGDPGSGIVMWVSSDGRLAQASTLGTPSAEFRRVIESVRPSSWDAVDALSARFQTRTEPQVSNDP